MMVPPQSRISHMQHNNHPVYFGGLQCEMGYKGDRDLRSERVKEGHSVMFFRFEKYIRSRNSI